MGQDGLLELEMVRISLVVVKLQYTQECGYPTGMPSSDMSNGPMPMTVWQSLYGQNDRRKDRHMETIL